MENVAYSHLSPERWTTIPAGQVAGILGADGVWHYAPDPSKETHDIHLFAAGAWGASRVTVQAEHRGGYVQTLILNAAANTSIVAVGHPLRFILTMATFGAAVSARVESYNETERAPANV